MFPLPLASFPHYRTQPSLSVPLGKLALLSAAVGAATLLPTIPSSILFSNYVVILMLLGARVAI